MMFATDLLIDGYNLLYAAGLGRIDYAPGELQRCRQKLLKKLFQHMTASEISHAAVVFDAREPPPGLPAYWYIHGLRVLYAQPHGDADILLEELIEDHSAPRRLTVVSSDHRLQKAARRRRATYVSSQDFLNHLERRRPSPEVTELPDPDPASPKATGQATAIEVDYWMRLFGDIKVADLMDVHSKSDPVSKASRHDPVSKDAHQVDAKVQPQPTLSQQVQNLARPKSHSNAGHSPKKRSRSSGKLSPSPDEHHHSGHHLTSLFSPQWIEELQQWTDELQGRKD